ncbi:Fanconi anemia core complex-associated protein 24-like [Trematomus bernacchii]|uniref:Fanconi anemia core complex-associated protein 24-like n=1 Tax=Trematomus bernacchii TaxID=40690 RepID=UPI00146BE296|nr:Fanconi anemia core complex-associated protein 24-like [Trematomus bernacchii]
MSPDETVDYYRNLNSVKARLQVHGEGRENPFRRRSSSRLLDPKVLVLVQRVPGVGGVKALALLQEFSSIHQLCNAAPHELEPIVGQAAAKQIHSFFHKPTAAGT